MRDVLRSSTESDDERCFFAEPRLTGMPAGYRFILDRMGTEGRFVYCKLNHGFWERLVRAETEGFSPEAIDQLSWAEFDAAIGHPRGNLARGGLLSDLLRKIAQLPSPGLGMNFVASLAPWAHSDRIEGTPFQDVARCTDMISRVVPEVHRRNVEAVGFTGHEFKDAAITGSIAEFLHRLTARRTIFVGNCDNRAMFSAMSLPDITFIDADSRHARTARFEIRDRLFAALESKKADTPPLILGAVGGALTCWLAFETFEHFPEFHFVDLGGMPAGFSPSGAARSNWMKVYQTQLARSFRKLDIELPEVAEAYEGRYGLRDPRLVEVALLAGVAEPRSNEEIGTPYPTPGEPIPFVENKPYDYQRISELLTLSVRSNHHANGGPVVALLERMVHRLLDLPEERCVVATNSGTSALHLAAGLVACRSGRADFRWVTCAFGFFSSNIGLLAPAIVIDSDKRGRLDFEALKALPLNSYDGVVYTNVFARNRNWSDIESYCHIHGKGFVVDNATGLLDRPDAETGGGAIEAISCHHTKPWGVGEAGLVLCDQEDEETVRRLANFGALLPASTNYFASNYKLSDLAAAAVIDRLERMPYWSRHYMWQERRMRSLIIDSRLSVQELSGNANRVLSPRAHTPFVCDHPVDVSGAVGPVTLRKYYPPVRQSDGRGVPTPRADELYARCFSLSNSPAMRLVPNEEIVAQLRRLCAA